MVGRNGNGHDSGDDDRPHLTWRDFANLGGKVEHDGAGREVLHCPGPNHGPDDRSLCVFLDPDAPGGFGVHSFADRDQGDERELKDHVRRVCHFPGFKPNGKANGNGRHLAAAPDPVVASYVYTGPEGEPVLKVNRTKAKHFWQQRPDGAGWVKGGVIEPMRVPYRLPQLVEAAGLGKAIFVVEGEKAADRLTKLGLTATCSPMGAGKWPDHFRDWFRGVRLVVILADNDDPGLKHAAKVAANLVDVAEAVRVVQLRGLKPGEDVVDWLDRGGDPLTLEDMPEGPPPRGAAAGDLWAMTFAAIKFAVAPYIAEGLTLLAGPPKRGKSWLALDLCVAVAFGGYTLGDTKCAAGDVLYCALEDSPRRMQARLKKVCQLAKRAPERLTFWFGPDMPRLGDGAEEALREWLEAHPAARLVVIDTLNYIRPERTRDEDPYAYDYRTAVSLQRLAGEFGVAFLVVHHTRKSPSDDYLEAVSGTNGLTGGSDAVLVLARDGEGRTLLKGRGRDVEEFELAMKFDADTCRWSVMGDPQANRVSETRAKILTYLGEVEWFATAAEVASQTGMKRNAVDQQLHQMAKAGQIVRRGWGKYGLPDRELDGGKPANDPSENS